jgi:hypothetical protein
MGASVGFAGWFFPVYIGFFVLVALVAVALLMAVLRRPPERFPGSWPSPRARWGAVPAIALVLLGLQLALIGLALVPGKAVFSTLKGWLAPGAATIGLATLAFAVATLAEGIAYLLRVAFPAGRRTDDACADDDAEAPPS